MAAVCLVDESSKGRNLISQTQRSKISTGPIIAVPSFVVPGEPVYVFDVVF